MKRFISIIILSLLCTAAFAAKRDTVRILAIGNSFSVDALEDHFYPVAAEAGVTVIVGNMYIGGCFLERHVNNLRNDAGAYSYRKITADGKLTKTPDFKLSNALKDEKWDYVSVQQSSPLSGKPESYEPWLTELVEYVRANAPQAELMFQMTWAYDRDSKHKRFPDYNKDQDYMYECILSAVQQTVPRVGIDIIIPSGTAVQNARTTSLVDNITRDGYHMSKPQGRYLLACTWVEKVLGRKVRGTEYCPEGMTPQECVLAQKAAHAAVRKPFKVTKIK